MKRGRSLSASAQKLGELLHTADGTYTVAVIGETDEKVSSFLNGLFGEEIFPSSINIGTSTTIKIKYGQQKKLSAIFKTGNTREYELNVLQMLSRYSESAGSFFQNNLQYFDLEVPYQFLENIILLHVYLGEASEEKRLLLEQADDAIWLFCAKSEAMPPVEMDVVPVGVVIDPPLDIEEKASADLLQKLARRKHMLRDVLGVSSMSGGDYVEFIRYLEQSVQNPVQRKKRFLKRLMDVMEELLVSLRLELGNPRYKAHCQRVEEFVNERSMELAHLKNSTITEIHQQEEEMRKWDFFSEKITTLRQLSDTLRDSPLGTDYTRILPFLSAFFHQITEFKRNVQELEKLQEKLQEQHEKRLGRGMGKWRSIFVGKQVLKEMEHFSRDVEQKHLVCMRWRNEIKNSQQQMKGKLKTILIGIEQEIYRERGKFVQKAYEAKQKYVKRVSAQTSLYEESCRFLKGYAYINELQEYLQHEFLPFLRSWGKKDAELSSYIFKIAHILGKVGKYRTLTNVDEDDRNIVEALQPNDIRILESATLPYTIQEQVPLQICEEFEPIIPNIRQMRYVYLRPYVITMLFISFTIIAYEIALGVLPLQRETNTDKTAVVQEETGTISTVMISAEQLVIRDSPSLQAKQIDTAMRGELYTVHSKQENWVQIRENEWIMVHPGEVIEGEIGFVP